MSENAARVARVIAAAWPSAETINHDGWTFRATSGVTRRANSVLVERCPTNVEAAIEAADAFYAARDLPTLFWVAEPLAVPDAVAAIERAGFAPSARTIVLASSCSDALVALNPSSDWSTVTTSTATDAWFAVYGAEEPQASEAAASVLRNVLLRAPDPMAFVAATDGAAVTSVGQVVVVDGLASIQCLATLLPGRRRGAARQVVRRLIEAAVDLGATEAAAAVMVDNVASRSLFESAGFRTSHHYDYFARPEPVAVS